MSHGSITTDHINGVLPTPAHPNQLPRSTEMHTMNEILARERMREARSRSRGARLARELAAQRRWHRVSRYARAAENRHAARVSELAVQ